MYVTTKLDHDNFLQPLRAQDDKVSKSVDFSFDFFICLIFFLRCGNRGRAMVVPNV